MTEVSPTLLLKKHQHSSPAPFCPWPPCLAAGVFFIFFKDFIYLFLERGERRERNTDVRLLLTRPLLGTWPTTQACALTGNRTSNPLVRSPVLAPLSHTSQGSLLDFEAQDYRPPAITPTPTSERPCRQMSFQKLRPPPDPSGASGRPSPRCTPSRAPRTGGLNNTRLLPTVLRAGSSSCWQIWGPVSTHFPVPE